MRIAPATIALSAVLTVFAVQGCDRSTPAATAPRARAPALDLVGLPEFDPASFVPRVTNPYFPLPPGLTYRYQSETPDGIETNTVEVTHDTKTILGVTATVVLDQVFLDGDLTERTLDWYAQDGVGNVWYLGEDTEELENGEVVSTEGSWEAGVDGAEAGIIMWADPGAHVGETYRQEFLEGEAQDLGKVVRLDAAVDVPFGHFTRCLETEDWSDLETVPLADREHKFYCPGIGVVREAERMEGEAVANELHTISAEAGAPTIDRLQTGTFGPDVYAQYAPDGGVWLRVRLSDAGDTGPWDWRVDWGEGAVATLNGVRRSGEFVFLHVGQYSSAGPHTIVVAATDRSGATSPPATITAPEP